MSIRIPISVRVPKFRDPVHLEALSNAVDSAIGQAHKVLAERHGLLGPIVLRPLVLGTDAPDVIESVRRGLVRHAALVNDGAGTFMGERNRDEAVREHDRSPRSSLDRGTYRLPFYDDGRLSEVPARPDKGPRIPTMAEVEKGLLARVREGTPGRYGAVDLGGTYRIMLVWLDPVSGIFWKSKFSLVLAPEKGQDTARTVATQPKFSEQGVIIEAKGPVDETWIKFWVNAFLSREVPDLQGADLETLSQHLQVVVAPKVQDLIVVSVTGIPEPFAATREFAGQVIHVVVDPTPAPEETNPGAGDGEGNNVGDKIGGRQGGSLGGGTGGEDQARTWPSSISNGNTFSCEPFEDELSLLEVAKKNAGVAEQLRASMERLARDLEISQCEYAGHFALNAARAIGDISHRIGLGARSSPGRTQMRVRPNGGGNNGIVDIAVEATPGLMYMRKLASLVTAVLHNGQMVQSSYNALGDNRAVPDTTQWGIAFLNELGNALEWSCAVMFAETCRVILLQQLASTWETLHHRSSEEGISDTVRHFESALGILGEQIVAADLMQRAIRRAGQLNQEGVAREILSVSDPYRSIYAGHHHSYDGGYIPYVAPAITNERQLALVADANVVRTATGWRIVWRSREWSHDDLDELKRVRRAFLNRIDPLFLQVDNLSSVHTRVHRDKSARPYLEDLLATLLSANDSITRKVKEADDGMWFALETSRYIEAKGGYTSLGTRFVMHGIHGLADAELRPHILGTTFQYNKGVDLAISRKARQDFAESLLEIGAVVVVAVICAPLGAVAAAAAAGAVSFGLAVDDVFDAAEREEIYRSLEDPESVLSWQEVQLEWLMATIGVAFSVFDVVAVGQALRKGMIPLKQALRQGLQETVSAQSRVILQNLAERAMEHAIRQAASEVAVQALMSQVMPIVVAPVVAEISKGLAVEHGLGVDLDSMAAPGEPYGPDERIKESTADEASP